MKPRATRSLWRPGPLMVLGVLHAVAIFAGFFAPYSYREQHRELALAPPTPLRIAGWPRVVPWRSTPEGELFPGKPVRLRFFVRGEEYRAFFLMKTDLHLFGVDPPHQVFLLGTDELGRDVFSRLLYGARISLGAGLLGASLAIGIALALGSIAGYCEGRVDALVMRLADLFLSVPWLYILLAARAFLPLDVEPGAAFLLIVALLGTLGWAGPARLIRATVLRAMEQEFVQAAASAGAPHFVRLWRHVIPQTYGLLRTQVAILVPAYMLAEVTLSFVGLGVGEPVPSWGNMLGRLHENGLAGARSWLVAPAVTMVIVSWLFHACGPAGKSGTARAA